MHPVELDRRKYVRLDIHDHAIAQLMDGTELGEISMVSGSGMQIKIERGHESLTIGSRHRIRVYEPVTTTDQVIEVIVRNIHDSIIGVEFL